MSKVADFKTAYFGRRSRLFNRKRKAANQTGEIGDSKREQALFDNCPRSAAEREKERKSKKPEDVKSPEPHQEFFPRTRTNQTCENQGNRVFAKGQREKKEKSGRGSANEREQKVSLLSQLRPGTNQNRTGKSITTKGSRNRKKGRE